MEHLDLSVQIVNTCDWSIALSSPDGLHKSECGMKAHGINLNEMVLRIVHTHK